MIDTQAFDTGLRHVREFNADAIELMPGLMPRVIRDLKQATDKAILAAGLIKSVAEVQTALDAVAIRRPNELPRGSTTPYDFFLHEMREYSSLQFLTEPSYAERVGAV